MMTKNLVPQKLEGRYKKDETKVGSASCKQIVDSQELVSAWKQTLRGVRGLRLLGRSQACESQMLGEAGLGRESIRGVLHWATQAGLKSLHYAQSLSKRGLKWAIVTADGCGCHFLLTLPAEPLRFSLKGGPYGTPRWLPKNWKYF